MAKISVCMATYNGEIYIYEQLMSIISQLKSSDEIIISDDSSTDRTIAIIESLNDIRIKIFPNQKFKNPIYNFENALKQATGEIIFLSDQDDIWHENKVVKMFGALNMADMVVCDCTIINDDKDVVLNSYFSVTNPRPGILKNLKKNGYLGCCMAFKKDVLKKALPFPKDIPMHDIWLGFICELFFRPVFLNESLTYYRKHSNNVSITSNVISHYGTFTKLKFRFNIVKYLPLLIFNKLLANRK
jgi:glycosyltransferase involved in cell wall biosynthesis